MDTFEVTFSAQELEDVRMALIAKWSDCKDDEREKSDRLAALMDKLARVSVLGHA